MTILRILSRWATPLVALGVLLGLTVATVFAVRAAPDVDRLSGPPPASVLLPLEPPPVAGLTAAERQPEPEPGTDPKGRCEEVFRGWRAGGGYVVVRIRRCESFEWAAYQQAVTVDDGRELGATTGAVQGIPSGLEMVIRQPTGPVVRPTVLVVARRGNYVLQVTGLSDPARLEQDAALVRAVARRQWSRLAGTPGTGVHITDSTTLLTRTGWFLGLLVIALYVGATAAGSVRNSFRGTRAISGPPAPTAHVTWLDKSARARSLARVARGRFWLIVGLMAASQALPVPLAFKALLLGLAPLFYNLGSRHTPGGRLLWGKHAESQIRTSRNTASAMGWLVLATVLLVIGLAALVTPAILLQFTGTESVGADGRWHPGIVADEPYPWRSVPVWLLAADIYAVSVGLLLTSSFVYRLARQASALDVTTKITVDPRAPIIFLRNFSDDDVTIRTSPLTRKSVVDKLGLQQFERFEEILVRYLSAYGPVIAVNNPNSRKAPLGAARETLPHDAWQDVVSGRIDACSMIVVAAAPGTDTAGLKWELDQIVDRSARNRTVLILPPYPATQLGTRWRRFLTMGGRLGVPGGTAAHADRILALTTRGDGEWDVYHADRRTDWAYAVTLAAVADAMTSDNPHATLSR